MADYRRFVAYIYEYQKGKKCANCGFVRFEEREHVCKMEFHIRCEGLIPDSRCEIYGFVRNKGLMDGSLLGQCMTRKDRMDYSLETDCRDMGPGGLASKDLGGLILLTENGGFFGTEWDDRPIRPENFHPIEKKKEHVVLMEEKNAGAESEENPELESEEGQELKTEESSEQKITESTELTEKSELTETIAPDTELQVQSVEPVAASESESGMVLDSEVKPEQKRPSLPGTPWEAFEDGEMTECRKITPDDLKAFGRRICMLRNNRFVQYGYYNFGHLLICKNHSGQYILGVPGCYEQQERFMANMFGFPYFKGSHQIRVPRGRGGYWYRSVDAPDLH